MKTGIVVGDAMSQNPVTADPELTIIAITQILIKEDVGSLLVVKGNKLLGIVTEKDIVRVLAKGLNPKKIKVDEIMTKRIHSIKPDIDLYEAIKYMKKHKVRRLPVLNKGNLVGMLTFSDIMKLQPILYEMLYDWGNMKASEKFDKEEENE
ncbi:MAG: CBS domain-containing protein [Nanoarchaeota archaeon]|nr:CBS domain-containing protein [Nanoarchaeota archaeon]